MDPIHGFIRLTAEERRIIDSWPVQRLRHISQLSTTHLVFPGATHRRFEHSLGVMELASRIYDSVVKYRQYAGEVVPSETKGLQYWRQVVRFAGLLHDTGHLPFSHAAEGSLLPAGVKHENLSIDIINSLKDILPVDADDVAKVAVGPGKYRAKPFSPWEALVADTIVGDTFGADRVDYLLRDSYHLGLAYGRFDHYKLIDEMRILPKTYEEGSTEPALGIEEVGCPAAEGLQIARYFMYQQVYFHPVRRAYDLVLVDFLREWLPNRKFPTEVSKFLNYTDNEVQVALYCSACHEGSPGHLPAKRFRDRGHYRVLYSWNASEARQYGGDPAQRVYEAARDQFGAEEVRFDSYYPDRPTTSFPMVTRNGTVISASEASQVFERLPAAKFGFVFVAPERAPEARAWLGTHKAAIFQKEGTDLGGQVGTQCVGH